MKLETHSMKYDEGLIHCGISQRTTPVPTSIEVNSDSNISVEEMLFYKLTTSGALSFWSQKP